MGGLGGGHGGRWSGEVKGESVRGGLNLVIVVRGGGGGGWGRWVDGRM